MSAHVIIAKYNPKWPEHFLAEKELIIQVLGDFAKQIEHIGSTAVPGLGAKPIIDIMVGIETLDEAEKCIKLLESIDYVYNPTYEEKFPERRSLDKKTNGIKIHLYLVDINTEYWKKHILFRDFLRTNPDLAKEYNKLKEELAKKYRLDRQAYAEGKSKFIKKVEKKARIEMTKYTS
ncbi:MAG: GrpB family protein [Candidatus Heimdallarchaeota archaeon]